MPNQAKHKWKPPQWLIEPVPAMARFHDADIEVYEGNVRISQIRLWRENYRTLLDIGHLFEISKIKDSKELTDVQIIDYIISQGLHKIEDLAVSIKKNGVRVPLIVSYDQKLLDGNRRFIACKYLLKTEKKELPTFAIVPVKCTAPTISDDLKLKIIAEMNFLPEYKEEWPREVRASFAVEQFEQALRDLRDEEKAYARINYFLQLSKADIKRFQAVLAMISEYADFVQQEGKKARQEAERFGRAKFQFFEEFYNKALGASTRRNIGVADEYKKLLYRYIRNQQLTSMLKVREFAELVQYAPSRSHLQKVNGTFQVAKQLRDEFVQSKELPSKIITFCEWLEHLSAEERGQVPANLRQRLLKAIQKLNS